MVRLLVVAVSALMLVGAATAQAAWTTPDDVSTAGRLAADPQVAVNDNGDAVFTWFWYDGANARVQARARSAAGVWSPVQTLTAPGRDATVPQVAVEADGDAVFTWCRYDGANYRVQTRTRAADGTLSAVQTLSTAGQDAFGQQVGVDADGDAVFIWYRYDGANQRAQARARSAAGALSAVQTLSPAGADAADPDLAVDAAGDAVFTWRRSDGANERVQTRARSAAGALSSLQTLSQPGQDAIFPHIAVDADGDAVFTWMRFDGTKYRIQARARSAAGVLSAVRTLSAAGQNAVTSDVAVDADGDAVFVWTRSDGAKNRIQARARSAAGVLSAVQTLSDAGQDAFGQRVDVDADGDAVFTWHRYDGFANRVQARTRASDGTLSAVEPLSAAPGGDPAVAVDADGDAVVAWENQGMGARIQASAGP